MDDVGVPLFERVWTTYGRSDSDGFVRRLRAQLRLYRVSQGELAREGGFNPTHVSRWLNEHVRPCLENKLLLDEALTRITQRREIELTPSQRALRRLAEMEIAERNRGE